MALLGDRAHSGTTAPVRTVPPGGPSGKAAPSGTRASSGTPAPSGQAAPSRLPGLAMAAAGVAVASGAHLLVPAVPMLTAAVVLGIAVAHLPGTRTLVRGAARPGLTLAGKRLMRVGIVLLGLKLGLDDVLGLGWATVLMVGAVVTATFFGTVWLGRKLGLTGDQPLLIATGYSICGASAIGAVSEVRESDERDVATSVALVTLCGTLAIAVLPLLQHPLGLDAGQFGRWVGAGVHDVGQVVATAQTAGPSALGQAVLVKLLRVMMLAPLVAAVAVSVRRRALAARAGTGAGAGAGTGDGSGQAQPGSGRVGSGRSGLVQVVRRRFGRPRAGSPQPGQAQPGQPLPGQPLPGQPLPGQPWSGQAQPGQVAHGARAERPQRPPLVPLFVLGFLAMVLLRTTGLLPMGVVDGAGTVQELLLAAALFGLGSAVHLPALARTGGRVAALGLCSWLVIAGVSYGGVLITT